ncbi:hypothetical protein AcV5_008690 [Taiwanofungus camphoratus]|nr:hypothetical protein AcV5_008690 [Antrodia cinnamomea]KAI0956236.1 hypothetical protein AcV7_006686 [Antrodia cinnamomea]
MMMSVMRANYIVFPISPRNSPAAVAHLINKVGVKHVLVGCEQVMQDLAKDALCILKNQYFSTPEPQLSPMPLLELFLPPSESDVSITSLTEELPYKNKDRMRLS